MALRAATDSDFAAMMGAPAPGYWIGMVEADRWLVHGIGGAYGAHDGRWWLFFQRCPGVSKVKTAHRAALAMVRIAREAGMVIHAVEDDRIDGAAKWIERLGFEPTGETIEGYRVWALR